MLIYFGDNMIATAGCLLKKVTYFIVQFSVCKRGQDLIIFPEHLIHIYLSVYKKKRKKTHAFLPTSPCRKQAGSKAF